MGALQPDIAIDIGIRQANTADGLEIRLQYQRTMYFGGRHRKCVRDMDQGMRTLRIVRRTAKPGAACLHIALDQSAAQVDRTKTFRIAIAKHGLCAGRIRKIDLTLDHHLFADELDKA